MRFPISLILLTTFIGAGQTPYPGVSDADSLSFRSLAGKYELDEDQKGTERCGFRVVKLKSSGKFVLIDDVLPINDLEIPNFNKRFGHYEISNDSTIVLYSERMRSDFTPKSLRKGVVKREQKEEFQFWVKGDTLVRMDFPFQYMGRRGCSFMK